MYDIVIIGAGPAGLTSAIYAKRANKNILVFEKNVFGGQIVTSNKVENYPGIKVTTGFEFANILNEQAKSFGTEIKSENVIRVEDNKDYKTVITDKGKYNTKVVIIATGARKRKLGILGEENFIGKGISYCATCDGNFFKNNEVAIVGGGNTALEDCLFLADICKTVYIIYRKDVFRGEKKLVDLINKKENIKVLFNSEVINITKSKELFELGIINNTNNSKINLNVSGLFVAIGQIPDNEIFENLIELDEFGYIKSNENCETNIPGIFAVGDCRVKKYRQLTTATADGTIGALNAIEYINKKGE